jgi:hypothetical protein
MENKYAAQTKWAKANKKHILVPFVLKTESDLLNHLQTKSNVSGYIKSLIRTDMEKNKQ